MIDLDVDSPWKVAHKLRAAAEAYKLSALDLSHYHQDRQAGIPWMKIASVLERAAKDIEKRIGR